MSLNMSSNTSTIPTEMTYSEFSCDIALGCHSVQELSNMVVHAISNDRFPKQVGKLSDLLSDLESWQSSFDKSVAIARMYFSFLDFSKGYIEMRDIMNLLNLKTISNGWNLYISLRLYQILFLRCADSFSFKKYFRFSDRYPRKKFFISGFYLGACNDFDLEIRDFITKFGIIEYSFAGYPKVLTNSNNHLRFRDYDISFCSPIKVLPFKFFYGNKMAKRFRRKNNKFSSVFHHTSVSVFFELLLAFRENPCGLDILYSYLFGKKYKGFNPYILLKFVKVIFCAAMSSRLYHNRFNSQCFLLLWESNDMDGIVQKLASKINILYNKFKLRSPDSISTMLDNIIWNMPVPHISVMETDLPLIMNNINSGFQKSGATFLVKHEKISDRMALYANSDWYRKRPKQQNTIEWDIVLFNISLDIVPGTSFRC